MDKEKAQRLANSILKLDTSIFGVSIVSNTGNPLARVRKETRLGGSPTPEQWGTKSFRNATIMGAARAEDKRLSRTRSIEIVREVVKELLIYVQSLEIIIDVLFDTNVNGTDLVDEIRNKMGLQD